MQKLQLLIIIVGLLFSLIANADNKKTHEVTNKIETLPRDLEIQLMNISTIYEFNKI